MPGKHGSNLSTSCDNDHILISILRFIFLPISKKDL